MASEVTPRWWGTFELERRTEQEARDAKRAVQERDYRQALLADVIRDGESFVQQLRAHFTHASQLSSEDIAALRAGAVTLGTQLAAVESALAFAEKLQ